MNIRKVLLLFTLLSLSTAAWAGELEVYGGANSTTYDDVPDANTWGVTMRLQYNFQRADDSWFINVNAPGISPAASEVGFGYEWKTGGDFFFEGGVGAGYGRIFGPFPILILGAGYRISQDVFFDMPIMLTSVLMWMPYIGISF